MGKNDPGGLKSLNKKQKSVGLQQLRFYCQMCQKQCRDANGFKCHIASESHLRQMRVFSENAKGFVDRFSEDFRKGYMSILSHRHSSAKIDANKVYNEYIADKSHVHMNATMWTSLGEFVKYLGRHSYVTVFETERGWDIQYIDRDPKKIARQKEALADKRVQLDDEERRRRQLEAQIAEATAASTVSSTGEDKKRVIDEFERSNEGQRIGMSFTTGKKKKARLDLNSSAFNNGTSKRTDDDSNENKEASLEGSLHANKDENEKAPPPPTNTSLSNPFGDVINAPSASDNQHPRLSNVEQLMLEEEKRVQAQLASEDKRERLESWLSPNIKVVVKNKELSNGKYYDQKGCVEAVEEEFLGSVRVLGSLIQFDQDDLAVSHPPVGHEVMVVNGRCRGCKATLLAAGASVCNVRVKEGKHTGRELKNVLHADVCETI